MNLKNIPHFEMDVNIDGVELFNNSEQAELIPILAVVHSIKKSAHCKEKKQILKSSIPVLLGYYHGQGKPEIKKFLASLLRDLKRLHPDNPNEREKASLEFTVTLQKIIQLRETNAPPRVDEDFYTYCKSDTVEDEHIINFNDLSPFSEIDFKMVSGFIIDSKHTVYGAFSRRLKGISSVKHEGKLKV